LLLVATPLRTEVFGILSGTYFSLLQLFLSSVISEVRSLIEIKEQHKEDDRVDDQHSCHQFWVPAIKYEDLSRVYEHQCELQLWNKMHHYFTLVHARAVTQNMYLFCFTASTQPPA